MRTLVLQGSSVSVKLEERHFVIHDHAKEAVPPVRVPLAQIDRVIAFGQPSISFSALAKLMDMRISCSFLSASGRWRGMIDSDRGFHAERRMRQYESKKDASFALSFARRIITSKIANGRRTLQRLAANRKLDVAMLPGYVAMTRNLGLVCVAKTLDAIRGVEGICTACYFEALSQFFPADAPFLVRSRRPPRDAANALLSFLYTLVEGDMAGAVRAHGLDVSAGYFHRSGDRSPSLALDLMEPFRPLVADRLALDLLNHRRIVAGCHFESCEEDGGCYLNEAGRAIVFRAYNEVMRRRSETVHGRLTMRQKMDKVVCGFLEALENEEESEIWFSA